MRWTFRIGLALGLLLATYTVWPFIDLYRLGKAVERRDLAAINGRIAFPTVQASVTRQVLATYLRITGKDARLSSLGRDVVVGLGTSAAQPAITERVTAERVLALFAEGWDVTMPGGLSGRIELAPRGLGEAWNVYTRSEYRFDDFYVLLPPDVPSKQQFRLRLRLVQWTWKLYELELPEDLRIRLAEEAIKVIEKK